MTERDTVSELPVKEVCMEKQKFGFWRGRVSGGPENFGFFSKCGFLQLGLVLARILRDELFDSTTKKRLCSRLEKKKVNSVFK